jgi:hypothetical protein
LGQGSHRRFTRWVMGARLISDTASPFTEVVLLLDRV